MTPDMLRRAPSSGFTLLELLVTVVVLAILLAIALPAQSRVIARSQLTTAANELFVGLQFARQESLRRNVQVQLCGSDGGRDCDGGNWQQWIVRTASGDVLRVGHIPSSVSVRPVGLFAAGMQFNADGMFHQRGGTGRDGTLGLCSPRGRRGLQVEVLGGVQVRMAPARSGGCQ
ncbi:GspH/FimT family pseudopilin [Stenotrophomonas sp. NPDC077659]|uniref:GspH/FimT family pseudopilin n=1 Tax=Stenotrophomonas sp. NPDC077659 TaxID=3390694 RepID=UPI003CFBEEA9